MVSVVYVLKFAPMPLTPPQGGEQEKGGSFVRFAHKTTAKEVLLPLAPSGALREARLRRERPMRSIGKGVGGMGF